jgi:hypothetical protein
MKQSISILGGLLLAAMLSSPTLAAGPVRPVHKGESQKGGLPALEDRVEADEALIATLQSEVATLQGQNNWAVVKADGTVDRSKGVVAVAPVEHTALSGQYEVTFTTDVSGCAYEATIGDAGTAVPVQGQISVSGDTDGAQPNDVFVQTFNKTGTTLTDLPFHLYVSCP